MNGIFSRWQPRYAEHGIATVPVDAETKIARMQWQKVGLPASAKMAQQPRYAAYNGIGFACGKRNRITVLDIDSTDERLLSEALARHGDTPIVERTASGKFHAFYRHNEEPRSCRQATGLSRYQKLWGADVPIDLLGAGLCVVTPTLNSRGSYEFIRGGLADIAKLPTIAGLEGLRPSILPDDVPLVTPLPAKWTQMRDGDGRNNALWERCMRTGHGTTFEQMLEIAQAANQEFREPIMDQTEVVAIAKSAWRLDNMDLNFFVRPRVMLAHDIVDALAGADPDAFALYAILDRYHGGNDRFVLAKRMAAKMNWTLRRWYAARDHLVSMNLIRCIYRGGRGPNDPAIYAWPLNSHSQGEARKAREGL
jgi:hypothetical protein